MEAARYLNLVSNHLERNRQSISFRTPKLSDIQYYYCWFQDLQVRRHLHPQTPQSPDNIAFWFNQRIGHPCLSHWMIDLSGQPIGHFAAKTFEPGVEASCVIGERRFIGTGIGILAAFYGFNCLYESRPQLSGVYISRLKNLSADNLSLFGFSLMFHDQNWDYYYQPKAEWQKIAALVSLKSLSPIG